MLVKAIKDTVALPSQNQVPCSFIGASELGDQLTSLSPFLLPPTYSVCVSPPVPPHPTLSLAWCSTSLGSVGGQVQLGKAGVCAVRAALSAPGNIQNLVSTSESYSWRDSQVYRTREGAGNWKLGVGVVFQQVSVGGQHLFGRPQFSHL